MKNTEKKGWRCSRLLMLTAVVFVLAVAIGAVINGNAWADSRHSLIATEDLTAESQWLNYFEYKIVRAPSGDDNGKIMITHCKEDITQDTVSGVNYNPAAFPEDGSLTVKGTVQTASSVSHGNDPDAKAVYKENETYDITMEEAAGEDSIFKNAPDELKNLTIESDVELPTSLGYFFQYAASLESITIDHIENAADITSMTSMFYDCKNLQKIKLTNGAFEKCVNLDYMFSNCPVLAEIDLKGCDFSAVVRSDLMFRGCAGFRKLVTPAKISDKLITAFSGRDVMTEKETNDEVVFYEERTSADVTGASEKGTYNAQENLLKGAPFKMFCAKMHTNTAYYRGIGMFFMTINQGIYSITTSQNSYNAMNGTQIYKIYSVKYGSDFYAEYLKEPSYYYPWGFTAGEAIPGGEKTKITDVNNPSGVEQYYNWNKMYPEGKNQYIAESFDGKFRLTNSNITSEDAEIDTSSVYAVPFLQDSQGFPVNRKYDFLSWDTQNIAKQYSVGGYYYPTGLISDKGNRTEYEDNTIILNGLTSTTKIRPMLKNAAFQVNYHNNIPGQEDQTETDEWKYSVRNVLRADKNYESGSTSKSTFERTGYYIRNWKTSSGEELNEGDRYFYWNANSRQAGNDSSKYPFGNYLQSYREWYNTDIDDNDTDTFGAQSVKNLTNKSCLNDVDGTLDGKVDLYANWDKIRYTIVYVGKDGINTSTSNCYSDIEKATIDGDDYTLKSAQEIQSAAGAYVGAKFQKGGLQFVGWSADSTKKNTYVEGGEYLKAGEPVTEDLLKKAVRTSYSSAVPGASGSNKYYNVIYLYAVFNDNYTVSFDANTSDKVKGTMDNQTVKVGTATPLKKCSFDRPGYTFTGWAEKANGNVVYEDGGSIKKTEQEISSQTTPKLTLYATWKKNEWSFTYHDNAGDGSQEQTVSYTYQGGSAAAPAPKKTKEGFALQYWSSDAKDNGECDHASQEQGSGKCGDVIHITPKMVISNLTEYRNNKTTDLYAIWGPVKYNVVYKLQIPEDSGMQQKADAVLTQRLTYAKEDTLASVASMLQEADGSELKEISITDGDGKTYQTYQTADGKYVFMGWTTASAAPAYKSGKVVGDTVVYTDKATSTFNLSSQNDSSVSLYGHWISSRSIIYQGLEHALFGETSKNPNPEQFNCLQKPFRLQNPERFGYTFAGWSCNGSLDVEKEATVDTDSTADIRYTAAWTADKFTITYKYDETEESPSGITMDTSTAKDYTVEEDAKIFTPKRKAYKFLGWTVSGRKDADGNALEDITIDAKDIENGIYTQKKDSVYGNLTYTARWKYQEFHVGYRAVDADGKVIGEYKPDAGNTSDIESGIDLVAMQEITEKEGNEAFTRIGYHLMQWTVPETDITYDDKAHVSLTAATAEKILDEDAVLWLYTKWEANTDTKYTVNLHFMDAMGTYDSTFIRKVEYSGTTDTTAKISENDPKIAEKIAEMEKDEQTKGNYSYSGDDYKFAGKYVNVKEDVIAPDGSLKLDLYFIRNYVVTYEAGEHGAEGQNSRTEYVPFGQLPTAEDAQGEITFKPEQGYLFKEWTFDREEDRIYEDKTYIAAYTPVTYKITYNMNAGTDVSEVTIPKNPQEYTIETETFTLAAPEWEGYNFIGWTLASESGAAPVKDYKINQGTTGDLTLLANWERNQNVKYTVNAHYMTDGKYTTASVSSDLRKGPAGEDVSVAVSDEWLVNTTKEMEEKNNCNYVIDPSKTMAAEEDDPNVYVKTIKGNGTTSFDIYYKQQYHVTLKAGDKAAAGSADISMMVEYGTDLTKADIKDFTAKAGYEQAGWDKELSREVTAHAEYTACYRTITYRIGYELNKGTVAGTNPETYTIESPQVTLINPTRIGYTFTGWTVKGQLGEPQLTQKTPLQGTFDVVYTANYTPNTDTAYSVLYKTEQLDGKYKIYDSADLTGISDEVIEPEPIEIEGFTTPETQKVTIRPDGELVINYLYKRNSYRIHWDLKGGKASNTYTEGMAKYESAVTAPTGIRKDGYTFTGWDKETISKMPAEAVEYSALYKVNTYSIKYELNGGHAASGSALAPVSYTIEDTREMPQLEKTGYVFAGWCEKKDCSDTPITSIEPGMFGNKVFYAKWNNAMDTKYTVEHYKQKLDGSYDKKADDVEILKGETTAVVSPATKKYTGFTEPKAQKLTIAATGSAVCRYYYTRNSYQISWDLGDGKADEKIPYTTGKVLYQDKITAPVIANKPAYSVSFSPKVPAAMGAQDARYTAVYTPNTYQISYEYNGGATTGAIKAVTEYNTEQDIAVDSLGILQKRGYEFAGWCFDKELTRIVTGAAIKKGDYGNKTFYAKWTPIKNISYTVEHYIETLNNPGEYEAVPRDIDHLKGHTDETVSPEVKDYEGFTAPETQTVTVDYDGTTVVKYYYKRNSYKLIWKVGDTNLTDELRYGKDIIVPPEVDREQYTFIGWDKTVLKKMPARDLIYTAQYKPKYYLKVTVPKKQTGYTLTVSDALLPDNGTTTISFRLQEHYAKTADFAILANGKRVELDENGNATLTGVVEDTEITVAGVADRIAPTGTVILPGTYVKEDAAAMIQAEDEDSGIAAVEYMISDHAMTEEEMSQLQAEQWNTYTENAPLPQKDGKYYVCARMTDNDGNTGYVCSDPVVVDTTAPELTGLENGKTYCGAVDFTVKDENLEYILLDEAYISNVTGYQIVGDDKEHTLRAVDKAGNTSAEITITVKRDHSYGQPVFEWAADYNSVQAVFTCELDPSHKKTVECDILKEVTQDGKLVYKAVANLNGEKYFDTKETELPPVSTPSAVPTDKTETPKPEETATAHPTQTPETTGAAGNTPAPSETAVVNTPAPSEAAAAKTATPGSVRVTETQKKKNALSLNAGLKVSQTGSRITIQWGAVTGAGGYQVYVQYCGKKFDAKSLYSVNNGKTKKLVVNKVNGKKLNLKKNYKIYVEAYQLVNGKKVILGKTITAHIVGRRNTKNTNVKGIKLSQNKYTLAAGKTASIKAKTILVDKKKKPLSNEHAKELRYATSDNKVATVSSSGMIKAVKKGSCIVYVYARNGYAKAIKVTVK